jgi:hypothetical protein
MTSGANLRLKVSSNHTPLGIDREEGTEGDEDAVRRVVERTLQSALLQRSAFQDLAIVIVGHLPLAFEGLDFGEARAPCPLETAVRRRIEIDFTERDVPDGVPLCPPSHGHRNVEAEPADAVFRRLFHGTRIHSRLLRFSVPGAAVRRNRECHRGDRDADAHPPRAMVREHPLHPFAFLILSRHRLEMAAIVKSTVVSVGGRPPPTSASRALRRKFRWSAW